MELIVRMEVKSNTGLTYLKQDREGIREYSYILDTVQVGDIIDSRWEVDEQDPVSESPKGRERKKTERIHEDAKWRERVSLNVDSLNVTF